MRPRWTTAACLLLVMGLHARPLHAQADSTAAFAEAVPVAEAWLALVDARRYDESWAAASEPFRRTVSLERWRSAVASVRAPYEPFGQRRLTLRRYATDLPGAPAGRYVILVYATTAPGGRTVTETLVATAEGDGWHVGGYVVREGE